MFAVRQASATLALELWTGAHISLPATVPSLLVPLLGSVAEAVVPAVAKALGAALLLHAGTAATTVCF
jgi:hypothetical protein